VDALPAPSPFLLEHLDEVAAAAAHGGAVDYACGTGRHALALAQRGVAVLGIDRDADALASLRERARAERLPVQPLRADLEAAPPPLAPGRCGALLVFRYLHRPAADALAAALRPGGLLLYETFTESQRELGAGPRNPAFLLRPGELPRLFPTLELLQHWEGLTPDPSPSAVARLLARRPAR
jgi:SAM-dependent methyltransferase